MSTASYKKINPEAAEALALKVFLHLAEDDQRLARFLDTTGLRPETLRRAAAEPGFFTAVLDHVAADEPLLVDIAKALEVRPEHIMQARQALSPSEFE